jgi:uncharacterized membrane protein YhaH (DUF805 family)
MSVWEILFGFQGRLARFPFFGYSMLLGFLLGGWSLLTPALLATETVAGYVVGGALCLALVIASLWSGLAMYAKRLHDLGLGGVHLIWLYGSFAVGVLAWSEALMIIASIVWFLASLWLLLWPGQAAANRFGPSPGSGVRTVPA